MWKQCVKRSLPHFGLLLVVIVYILVGAAIIQAIESPHQHKELNFLRRVVTSRVNESAFKLHKVCSSGRYSQKYTWAALVQEHFGSVLTDELLTAYGHVHQKDWTYSRSVFYCFTLLTTIGHAGIYPTTVLGRGVSILYCIVGIPLTLVTVANLGKFFAAALFLFLHHLSVARDKPDQHENSSFNYGSCVSFTLVFLLLLLYLAIGAACYGVWEGIGFFDAFHYFTMTLFTVGSDLGGPMKTRFIFVVILYIMLGLVMLWLMLEMVSILIRKIHYVGIPPKDLSECPVYFGNKQITAKQLAAAVTSAAGLHEDDTSVILANLDDVINDAIADPEAPVAPLLEWPPFQPGWPFGILYNIAQDSIPFFDDRASVRS